MKDTIKVKRRWILVCKDGREYIFNKEELFRAASLAEYPERYKKGARK